MYICHSTYIQWSTETHWRSPTLNLFLLFLFFFNFPRSICPICLTGDIIYIKRIFVILMFLLINNKTVHAFYLGGDDGCDSWQEEKFRSAWLVIWSFYAQYTWNFGTSFPACCLYSLFLIILNLLLLHHFFYFSFKQYIFCWIIFSLNAHFTTVVCLLRVFFQIVFLRKR